MPTNGSITNGLCQFNLTNSGIFGNTQGPTGLVSFPFSFPNVSFIQSFSGTFTPKDDYVYLSTVPNPATAAVNFIYIVTSGYTLISQIYQNGSVVVGAQGLFLLQPTPSNSNYLNSIYIDGRIGPNPSGGYAPMAQGTTINYYGVVANATSGGY